MQPLVSDCDYRGYATVVDVVRRIEGLGRSTHTLSTSDDTNAIEIIGS